MNIALITAAGNGTRIGRDLPKQFIHVNGRPLIIHTLQCFQCHPNIDAIAVVCLNGWESILKSYAKQYGIEKINWIFAGGETGMESIRNGVYGLRDSGCSPDDIIMVHDGVRPLVSQEIISSNLATCMAYGCAITGIQCQEHILVSNDGFCSTFGISRDNLIRTQTPHTMRLSDFLKLHEKAQKLGITNSVATCSLIEEVGADITMHIVPGAEENIKITNIEDFEIMKALMEVGNK